MADPEARPLSDKQITDFFLNKTSWKKKMTAAQIALIRAAATPVPKVFSIGRIGVNHWEGTCDVDRMAELVGNEPALLQSVGPFLMTATLSMRGCAAAAKFLLDRGVPVDVSYTGYDVRHEATWAGCTDNLRHLFESGAADASGTSNPHTGWPDNVTLLYWATFHGPELIGLLLRHGADPEIPIKGNGERGTTVLQHAIAPPFDGAGAPWDNPEIIAKGRETADFLLAYGVNYDLYSACGRDDIDRVRQIAAQDDLAIGRPGEADMTPLHWAVRGNASRCTKWMLARGVDVNAETVASRTPLHMAAEWGHTDMIWQLAGQGADLNCQDSKGRTPLHRATYAGRVEAAECLIVLGASTRLETRTGKNPIEAARFDCKYLKAT